jgi:hypothetical protein
VIDISICFDIFSRERNPSRHDGVARNRGRRSKGRDEIGDYRQKIIWKSIRGRN